MAHTGEPLRQLINKIATEQKYENHEININEISSCGANYTSKLYTVITREANKEDLHLFAKVATIGEKMRDKMLVTIFDTEVFAYSKLSKIYASLEEGNGVPEEHRLFFTKCYGFDPSLYQETLVLENLLAHGYGSHDRFHSIDWEYASSAITELAKMHALSFAYSKNFPEEFEKTLASFKMELEGGSMEVLFQQTIGTALKTVKLEYRKALDKFLKNMKNPFTMYGAIRKTAIVHGDYRGDNLLHRVREVCFYHF